MSFGQVAPASYACEYSAAQQDGVMQCQASVGQGYVQGVVSPVQGFMPCMLMSSPNGNGFTQPQEQSFAQNGQGFGFMPTPTGNNFMGSPNGQGFMPTPTGNNFMVMGSPNGQGFMPTPTGNNFMVMGSPNGQGFMPAGNTNNFVQQSCMASPQGQGFSPSPSMNNFAAPVEVSEKVLSWLSKKALETLGEVLAEEDAESEAEADVYGPLVAELHAGNVSEVATAILRVHSAFGTASLAEAICARTAETPEAALACANLLVVLLARLPAGHRREAVCAPTDLLAEVVRCCHACLEDAETETPQAGAHGIVLFLGELYNRQLLGLGEVKALFGKLVFHEEEHPLDHASSLACHLFLTAGPYLEKSALGRKLSEVMCARLRELKGMNYSEATLFSLAHVTELKLNKWVTKDSKPKKGKTSKAQKAKPEACAGERSLEKENKVPLESKEKNVLLIGELFTKQCVAAPVVKELFNQLLFTESPTNASVEVARRLLTTVGSTLDQSPSGQTLRKFVELRLQEVGPVASELCAASPGRAFSFRSGGQACQAC